MARAKALALRCLALTAVTALTVLVRLTEELSFLHTAADEEIISFFA